MRAIFLAALVAGAFTAAPVIAQDYGASPSGSSMSGSMAKDSKKMTPEQMRAHCKSMLAKEKAGDHSAMAGKSDADIKKMHDKCAAVMGQDKSAPATKY